MEKIATIRRRAERSTLFKNAYGKQAVCAPSRNALMTGMRPDPIGIYHLSTNFRLTAPDTLTLPAGFPQQQGNHTAALRKNLHTGQGNHKYPASWTEKPWKPDDPQNALRFRTPRPAPG